MITKHRSVKQLCFLFIAVAILSCKKSPEETPVTKPADPEPAPVENKIKITYEITSTAEAFTSPAYNKVSYAGSGGSYLFDTYSTSTWKKEVTITDDQKSSIILYVDLLLNGDKATATGKVYINDVLKSTATSTSPYYSNGRTQTILDVRYR
ncbi:hypothetical protein MUGA111182_06660 [Mucilaginibacter galii]|uniref:Uncharacterized protein n=1 Tax=Mucilaginibacter galii TaxID=2005073 RepID=A0A917N281_9SPHI|nr:hypothetical protein [Mucilaginibacter galii]GGI51666.1 hypothetical protein GCM10011425_28780 [Mucilaginibacter galii]